MNAPDLHRSILRHHVATIEAKYPLRIVGRLPRGGAAHIFDERALDLLGRAEPGLSYIDLASAEGELSDMLGRPVGIVLVSELSGHDAEDFPRQAQPL